MADLRSDVVNVLNDLIENARDGEYGFRTCAEQVESARLKQVFNDRSTECAHAAQELAQWVRANGGEPADGGTASGALHRARPPWAPTVSCPCWKKPSAAKTPRWRATAKH